MFSSTTVAPSLALRAAQQASNSAAASNIALKRKRDDIIAPRNAPAKRDATDVEKTPELANIYHIFQAQSGLVKNWKGTRKAKLLPSGDLIIQSDSKISLVMNALQSSKCKVVNVFGEDCHVADLDREVSISNSGSIHASLAINSKQVCIIGCSTKGK